MKQNTDSAKRFESTYALLVRFEEDDRWLLEDVVYLLFILSAVFSIWVMVNQPIEVPTVIHTASVAQSAKTLQS